MGAATDEVQRAWLRQGPVCACGPKAPMYYRGADAALVVYDLTSRDTFDGLAGWVNGMPASRRPPPPRPRHARLRTSPRPSTLAAHTDACVAVTASRRGLLDLHRNEPALTGTWFSVPFGPPPPRTHQLCGDRLTSPPSADPWPPPRLARAALALDLFVVANKKDIGDLRQVPAAAGQGYAQHLDAHFCEVSAKDSDGARANTVRGASPQGG